MQYLTQRKLVPDLPSDTAHGRATPSTSNTPKGTPLRVTTQPPSSSASMDVSPRRPETLSMADFQRLFGMCDLNLSSPSVMSNVFYFILLHLQMFHRKHFFCKNIISSAVLLW